MGIVEIKALKKSYISGSEELPVLKGVDFSLEKGEIALITGESGSGKSTFLNILGGLDRAESGSIVVDGQSIEELREESLSVYRKEKIGFIFQFHYLMKDFNTLENVFLPLYMGGMSKKQAESEARRYLDIIGLSHRLLHYPSQLSGGERQRAAVARALINDPSLVLADEPTGNLDEKNSRMIEELLFKLVKDFGKTLILVTHDTSLASRGDYHLHLEGGSFKNL
ncbi:MAG: ABC transporter ATP-binding protein [Spirochaetales bacterium]|nr:ABC transporter ATP-binding protein [Spirochaetales bacterium]